MKRKTSIRNITIIYFSILVIVVIVAQLMFNLFLLKPFVSYSKTRVIENSFSSLKKEYNGNADDVSLLAEEIQNKHGIKIVLFDDDGIVYTSGFSSKHDFNILSDKRPLMASPNNEPPQDMLGDSINNTDAYSEKPDAEKIGFKNNVKQLVLKGKFYYQGKNVYVLMNLPMETIDANVSMYTKTSTIILAFALIIGIVLAFVFSKNLTKPITNIQKVAHSLSNLDFSVMADENISTVELESLAKSINTMSINLKTSIDNLQIANEELKKDISLKNEIESMRRQFIANVSHEMKTPLGLLQIYCENLKSNVDGIDKEYYCDVIVEEVQNLNDMVMSMLDVSSIESGLSKMNLKRINLSAVCNDALLKFKNAYNDYSFLGEIEKDVFINGDEKYISQAINNYITNAISHTSDGGAIKLALKNINGTARLSVFNNGKNIEESIDRIWEPFYKSDKARTRNGKNNVGLGLYIVKTIVEKHDGTVFANNMNNGVEFGFDITECR